MLREYGAECITCADDVRALLGIADPSAAGVRDDRTSDATRVLDALSRRSARPTEDVARRAGMAPEDAQSTLGLLALEGAVARTPEGWRRVD